MMDVLTFIFASKVHFFGTAFLLYMLSPSSRSEPIVSLRKWS
jgi:hypothetical protein